VPLSLADKHDFTRVRVANATQPTDFLGVSLKTDHVTGHVATWGNWLWPTWLGIAVGIFLAFEVYALCTNSGNTLSAWVWRALKITRAENIGAWSATDFLVFGCWLTLVLWLTGHFFFGRFT
jgi:hypothetical protein